ncbi:MAG: hypothetical protein V1865_02295 [bacterium]
MRKTSLSIILPLLLLAIFIPAVAKAFEIKSGDVINIKASEVVDGNLYIGGSMVTVDANINGDVFCAGQTININGNVAGDIICAGETINVNGEVGGNVRIAGQHLSINNKVARNVNILGNNLNIGSNADIGWDLMAFGANISMAGKVGSYLHGGGANLFVSGEVGKDIKFDVDKNLTITDGAIINGNVNYSSTCCDASIADGAVKGEVVRREAGYTTKPKVSFYKLVIGWGIARGIAMLSAILIGLVFILVSRKQSMELTELMSKKFWTAIGIGAIILFLVPIASIILLITVIGIPLAIICLLGWIIFILISKVFVGLMVGQWIMDKWFKANRNKKFYLFWSLVVGVIVCWILFSLPFIGWVLTLIAMLWGIGGIVLAKKKTIS